MDTFFKKNHVDCFVFFLLFFIFAESSFAIKQVCPIYKFYHKNTAMKRFLTITLLTLLVLVAGVQVSNAQNPRNRGQYRTERRGSMRQSATPRRSGNYQRGNATRNVGEADNEVRDVAAQQPQYPGGTEALKKFFDANVVYPAEARRNGIQGTVIMQFIVEKDGSLSDITVLRNNTPELTDEAIRVLKKAKRFHPGLDELNRPVRVRFTFPYAFRLR